MGLQMATQETNTRHRAFWIALCLDVAALVALTHAVLAIA
jgi:hypothetical protein